MATYKVLQDIEAEDKLIGPLSLKQFIYAIIAVVSAYLIFFVSTHGLAFMSAVFVPVMLFFGFLAFPWGGDQPTEIWALAKIRFLIKPRRRIWDQSGITELVTITAPKKSAAVAANNISQSEVKSRLRVLADTIDSRGWAIKGANVNLYANPIHQTPTESDRLVAGSSFPQQVSNVDVQASDDMLDEQNNPRAQAVNSMVDAAAKAHRQKIIDELNAPTPQPPAKPAQSTAPAKNFWFLDEPAKAQKPLPKDSAIFKAQVVEPGMSTEQLPAARPQTTTADYEASAIQQLKTRQQQDVKTYGHMHNIRPLEQQRPKPTTQKPVIQSITQPARPVGQPPTPKPAATPQPTSQANKRLAANDDYNIATIAREANRQDEVVINLH